MSRAALNSSNHHSNPSEIAALHALLLIFTHRAVVYLPSDLTLLNSAQRFNILPVLVTLFEYLSMERHNPVGSSRVRFVRLTFSQDLGLSEIDTSEDITFPICKDCASHCQGNHGSLSSSDIADTSRPRHHPFWQLSRHGPSFTGGITYHYPTTSPRSLSGRI